MAQPEQKFIVFNYVTSRVEQSDQAPTYGDPNSEVQASATTAYAGATSGVTTLSSATVSGATVSQLADPAAQVISIAQASVAVSAQQLTQLQQTLGGLDLVGQLPATLSSMQAHAANLLENGTRVFEAIDLTFQPDQAGSPTRCSSISDFIGSIQGAYNDTLQGVTRSLNEITNALVSIPTAIITAFTTTVNQVITAIQSGVQSVINQATAALSQVSNQLFGGLSAQIQGLIREAGAAITQVQQAIQAEIDRVSAAISDVTNNLFRLVVPNVNPCLRNILSMSNSSNFELPPLTQNQIELRRLSGVISTQVANFPSTFP
jgi:phage-related protein